MNFYELETGRSEDPDFVYLKDAPQGLESDTYRMAEGERMGADYPVDAKVKMGPDSRGTALPSLIGNMFSMLIVKRELKDVLVATGVELECLPFTLINRKNRVASRDYFIVNPIGAYECIDDGASAIKYSKAAPSVILGIDPLVLDPVKLESAPDFFRMARQLRRYVVSERLGKQIAKLGPTNVNVHKLEQRPARKR